VRHRVPSHFNWTVPALLVGRSMKAANKSSAVLASLFAVARQCSIPRDRPLMAEQQAAHHTCSLFCGFGLRELGEKKYEPEGKFTLYPKRSRGVPLLVL